MKILFACHRVPYPPKRGGKIRPFNIIRHFSEQGHRVTVGSLARSESEIVDSQGLLDYCERLHIGKIGRISATTQMVVRLPTPSPSSMGYFYSAALHKLMRAELERFDYDLIFVHCSSAAQYVRAARGIPSILDFGDMDSQKWLDYSDFKPRLLAAGYWLEGVKLQAAEKRLAGQFDICTCTTRAELETLQTMRAASRTAWFPNGVDSAYFQPVSDDYDPENICFVGRMDYYPNQQGVIQFCRDILPRIRALRPKATFTIVGAEPSADIRALSDLPGVCVTGTVDDVRPYVRKAALTVAPLAIARGTQNKILESMAMGVPVVCSETAAGGVDATADRHILVASNSAKFAEEAISLLVNPAKRQKVARLARERVLTHHSWAGSMSRLDDIVAGLKDGIK